jgi:small subunit ribosomal protein S6
MKRRYETVAIFDGSLTDELLSTEQKKFEEFLQKHTEYEKTEIWGKRNLAYEIKKKKTGYYCLFIFQGEGNISQLINNEFKLNPKIIRQMTVLHEPAPKISPDVIKRTKTDLEEGEE